MIYWKSVSYTMNYAHKIILWQGYRQDFWVSGNCQCFNAALAAQFLLCRSILLFCFLFAHSWCVGKIRKNGVVYLLHFVSCVKDWNHLIWLVILSSPARGTEWRGAMSMRSASGELSLTHRWVTQHRAPISCLVFTCRVLSAHKTPPYTWIRGLLVTGSVVLLLYTANSLSPALYLAQTCLCAMHRHTDKLKKAT